MNVENKVYDALSWDKFLEVTSKEKIFPPKKIDLFNRLLAHTDNFFIIAAIGAFVPGYVMIVSKNMIPSFALIEDNQLKELNWLIENVSNAIKNTYDKEIVIFEHGMCACIGGLDRAHLHIMPINKKTNNKTITESINNVLQKRRSGISSVEVDNYKFENIHDITEIMNGSKENSYKINGKQYTFSDIQNLDINNWPISASPLVAKGGHYVYFKNSSLSSSFLSDKNFQTQLGREIVFEIEKKINPIIQEMTNKILKKNNFANIWKWQEFAFKDNIYKTMDDLIVPLLNLKLSNGNFNFEVMVKKD